MALNQLSEQEQAKRAKALGLELRPKPGLKADPADIERLTAENKKLKKALDDATEKIAALESGKKSKKD